jgi:hypothetical protein
MMKDLTKNRRLIMRISFTLIFVIVSSTIWISLRLSSQNKIQEIVGYPYIFIKSVVPNQLVSIQGYNFQADDMLVVTMGPFGSYGIGGIVVAETSTGSGGSFDATYDIPDELKGMGQIAIRFQSPSSGFYAYNWFYNDSTNTSLFTPSPALLLSIIAPKGMEVNLQIDDTVSSGSSASSTALYLDVTAPKSMDVDQQAKVSVILSKPDPLGVTPVDSDPNIGVVTPYDQPGVCFNLYLDSLDFKISDDIPNCITLNESGSNWSWQIEPVDGMEGTAILTVKAFAVMPDKTSNPVAEKEFEIQVFSNWFQRIGGWPEAIKIVLSDLVIGGLLVNVIWELIVRKNPQKSARRKIQEKAKKKKPTAASGPNKKRK